MNELINLNELCDEYSIPQTKLRNFRVSSTYKNLISATLDNFNLDVLDINQVIDTKRGKKGYTKVHPYIAKGFLAWCDQESLSKYLEEAKFEYLVGS